MKGVRRRTGAGYVTAMKYTLIQRQGLEEPVMGKRFKSFARTTLSRNLRYLRRSHNLTQSAVASLLGISRSTYSMLERGKTQMTLEQAFRICQLYGLSASELVSEELLPAGLAGSRPGGPDPARP